MPEDGTTENSSVNAKELLAENGMPKELHFNAHVKNVYYRVEAVWPNSETHIFLGFAWGYGGTGPAGLVEFLNLAQVSSIMIDDIPIDKYGKTMCSWYRDPKRGQLTETEWRTIHNALSVYQNQGGFVMEGPRKRLQQLMDKIRDNYIAPTDETHPLSR